MGSEGQVKGISIERKNKLPEKKKISAKTRRILTAIESILVVALSFSVVFLGINYILDMKSEKKMDDIRKIVKESRLQFEKIDIPQEEKDKNKGKKEERLETAESEAAEVKNAKAKSRESQVLPIFKEMHEANENFAGWLYVEDTNLEYPIMQGPDNKFYLSHDMDGVYDKYGMLILDDKCDIGAKCPQLVIYGHNVNSGKLFGELLFYKEEAYCDYHPQICFDTLYGRGTYTVFAAFTTTVPEAEKNGKMFSSWDFTDKESYDDFVRWAKGCSLYQRECEPEYGQAILSLVTCEHSNDEGRFIVLAANEE